MRFKNTLNEVKDILDITEENMTIFEDSDRNYAKWDKEIKKKIS